MVTFSGYRQKGPSSAEKNMKINLSTICVGTAIFLLTACDSGGGTSTRTLVSPDQAYTAFLITEIGGEFAGSSCVDTVVVIPGKSASSANYPKNSRAYVGGCHSLKMTTVNGQSILPDGPQLLWTAPHELHIIFDPKLARQGVSEFYSVASLYDGAVAIHNETQ